ncbi:MAG: hypothetical protein ABJA98_20740 [Acidobacteriota bacterium]
MTLIIVWVVITICATVLALALYKGDVTATLKFLGVGLILEAKERRK